MTAEFTPVFTEPQRGKLPGLLEVRHEDAGKVIALFRRTGAVL